MQVYEKVNDSLMKRTMNRPLPTGRMSRAHALAFAAIAGVGGVWLLAEKVRICGCMAGVVCGLVASRAPRVGTMLGSWSCGLPAARPPLPPRTSRRHLPLLQTNLTTAALGAANIVLYAGVYTPLKQVRRRTSGARAPLAQPGCHCTILCAPPVSVPLQYLHPPASRVPPALLSMRADQHR